jgi:hypothetical protein
MPHRPHLGKRELWDITAEPLAEPLPHQFRCSVEGQRCEADFQTMTLSVVRSNDLLLSEEPVLYDLSEGPDGRLRMRLNDDSRQIMVANIEDRLADPKLAREAAADGQDRAKIARLHEDDWSDIQAAFAEAIDERYAAFVGRCATRHSER